MLRERKESALTLVALLFWGVLTLFFGEWMSDRGFRVRQVNGLELLLLTSLGLAAVWAFSRARIPECFDTSVSRHERWTIPLGIGILFGLLDVLVVEGIMKEGSHQELPPYLQPFPYSIFLYTTGAYMVEITHRLLPMTAGLWLLQHFIQDAGLRKKLSYVLCALLALWEPLGMHDNSSVWMFIYTFGSGWLMNFLQCLFFWKYGFVSALNIRLGHYLIWHIVLGIYVQYVEIPSAH